jgi:replicative DNA helicase
MNIEHYNADAERAVLGAILEDTSILPKVLDAVNVQDFYFEAHKATLRAFIELQEPGKPVPPVLLTDILSRTGKVDGVHLFVSELMDSTPSTALVGDYCKHIKEKAVTRRIIETAQQIQQRAEETTTDVDGLLSFAQQSIMTLSATTSANTGRDMRTLARTAFATIEERKQNGGPTGITSGFEGLDQLLAGLRPGLFYPVAGRPGTGKTAIALNIARAVAGGGYVVVFFSLEMPSTELTNRLLSSETGIDGHKLNRGYLSDEEWGKAVNATDRIARLPIFIDDATLSIDRIATRARRHKAETGLDLVIVDYLQLVPPSRRWNTREQEVSEVSRTLKAIAKELNVPVIAGAQLNRNIENRTTKTPTLADLRESGAIEQDADAVIFIVPKNNDGGTELVVEKNRQGPTGSVSLTFDKRTTTFKETRQL